MDTIELLKIIGFTIVILVGIILFIFLMIHNASKMADEYYEQERKKYGYPPKKKGE